MVFRGRSQRSIDAKGRLMLPPDFRGNLLACMPATAAQPASGSSLDAGCTGGLKDGVNSDGGFTNGFTDGFNSNAALVSTPNSVPGFGANATSVSASNSGSGSATSGLAPDFTPAQILAMCEVFTKAQQPVPAELLALLSRAVAVPKPVVTTPPTSPSPSIPPTPPMHPSLPTPPSLSSHTSSGDKEEIRFVITTYDNCLVGFPWNSWLEMEEKFSHIPNPSAKVRAFRRLFIGGAEEQTFDPQGRIRLSSDHREYAGLDKEAMIIGMITRFEIWNPATYKSAVEAQNFDDVAEELAASGIDFTL